MTRLSILSVSLALFLGSRPAPAVEPSADRVASLIAQLGSPNYQARESATKELDAIGRPALPALTLAARTQTNEEIARRAGDLAKCIARRADNEDTLAATLVELNAKDVPLSEVLASLEKQSGYRLAPMDDPAVASRKIAVTTSGKVPFWTAIEAVCAAAGLEVGSTSPPIPVSRVSPYRDDDARLRQLERIRQARAAAEAEVARALADATKKQLEVLERVTALLEARLPVAGAEEKKKLEEQLRKQKDEAAVLTKKLAEIQTQLVAVERTQPKPVTPVVHPAGTVALRVKSAIANPSYVSGAVRVEATPFPADARATVPTNELPTILTLTLEPKLFWQQVTDVRVTKAVDDAGRSVAASAVGLPLDVRVQPVRGGRIVMDANGGVSMIPDAANGAMAFTPATTQGLVKLKHGNGPAPKSLRTIEGKVCGTIRTATEDLVVVTGLEKREKQSANGTNGLGVDALVTYAESETTTEMTVTLRYDPSQVQPGGSGASPFPNNTRIVRGPGNMVIQQVGVVMPNNGFGEQVGNRFILTDAAGKPFTMTVSSTQNRVTTINGMREYTQEFRMRATTTEAKQGVPAKLVVRGSRLKQVEIPFRLTDVPVVAGTGPIPIDVPPVIK